MFCKIQPIYIKVSIKILLLSGETNDREAQKRTAREEMNISHQGWKEERNRTHKLMAESVILLKKHRAKGGGYNLEFF